MNKDQLLVDIEKLESDALLMKRNFSALLDQLSDLKLKLKERFEFPLLVSVPTNNSTGVSLALKKLYANNAVLCGSGGGKDSYMLDLTFYSESERTTFITELLKLYPTAETSFSHYQECMGS